MGCDGQKFLFPDAGIRIRIPGIAEPVTVGDLKRDDFFRYARIAAAHATGRSRLALMLFAQGEQMPVHASGTFREFLSNQG